MSAGTWSRAPSLRHGRAAHAVAATAGKIYVLGGSGSGAEVVEAFDGAAWHDETALPHGPLNAPAAAALDSRVFVAGGFSGRTNRPVAEVEVYDTADASWSAAAPLPAPRGGHAAVVLGGRIHVLGGGNDVSTIADHDVYDAAADAWTAAAPLPSAEGSPAAVVFDGALWAIGGRSGLDDFGDVYVYDEAADTWREGPPIPPRGTAGAAVHGGAIHVFGGESQSQRAVLGEVLRLGTDGVWQEVSALPSPRNYARAVVLDSAVLVVGGSLAFGDSHRAGGSTVVERYAA